jgi:N-acetylglucosaminyl-diphospho-decaprenol L-rhamnosyltransferase
VAGTTAVVVTYNSEEVIEACVAALGAHAPEVRVLVIDNASRDETVARARAAGAEVIANEENRGFAGAVNQGFRATDTELVLVMNPDVRIRTELTPLEEAARKHGAAGGLLTDGNGVAQTGFTIRRFPTPTVLSLELLGVNRLWPGNPWNRHYRYTDRDLEQAGAVDQPAGAFLMIRRDVWTMLGGMDEQFYPIWFEDVDFCRRASEAGVRMGLVPEVRAEHQGAHSIGKMAPADRQVQWYDSVLKYSAKHFRPAGQGMVWMAGAVGAIPRALVGSVQERSLRPIGCSLNIFNILRSRLVSRPPSGAQRPGSED